jgi:hypothetical protein
MSCLLAFVLLWLDLLRKPPEQQGEAWVDERLGGMAVTMRL